MKRRKVSAALNDDAFEKFEQLALQISHLQAMSNEDLLTDDELQRFFSLILPAQHAALELEREKAKADGRSLTQAEFQAVSIKAFVAAAGDAAREVWGGTIGELIDGRKSQ